MAVGGDDSRKARRHTHHQSQFPSQSDLARTDFTTLCRREREEKEEEEEDVKEEEEEDGDTLNPIEEEKMRRMFYSGREKDSKPSFCSLQDDEPGRRPSVNVYQSVDEDHPDLQSIQSIVANMNFSAD